MLVKDVSQLGHFACLSVLDDLVHDQIFEESLQLKDLFFTLSEDGSFRWMDQSPL